VAGGGCGCRGNLASGPREQQVRVHKSRRRGTTPLNSSGGLKKDCCLAGKRLRTLQNGSWHKVLEKEAGLCCAEERERFGERTLC
jgi:hypothetical protein